MVRFVHAADLHLDSPFSGLKHLPRSVWEKVRESTFTSLNKLVNKSIEEKVDFVLFSGDIYDIDDRSVKAQARFKEEMYRLAQVEIPVFIIHGNHDFLSDQALHLKLPDNVTVFGTTVETAQIQLKTGERVAISGFSYNKRWINDRMIRFYPVRSSNVDMHIGLLHGFQEGQSSEHANYAPFSLSELQEKRYDYWALGHIHKQQKIADYPLIYYPGNSQGLHRNEVGEKGFLLVNWSPSDSEVSFIPSAPVIWDTMMIDASKAASLNEVFEKVEENIPQSQNQNFLVSIRLIVSDCLSEMVQKKIMQEGFKEALHQVNKESFTWIVNLSVQYENEEEKIPALEQLFPEAFRQAVAEVTDGQLFDQLTNDFFHQNKQASLLTERSEAYREMIVKQAVKKLQQVTNFEGDKGNED